MKGNDSLILDFQYNRNWNKELALGMEGVLKQQQRRKKQAPELFVFHHPFQCGWMHLAQFDLEAFE